jgi:UDP-2-acetamido-3-amino-2,3-dideoxy-glucuronate N-acetyltransferase
MIDPDVKLGLGVRIWNPDLVNLFGCEIGDGTFVGPFVEITAGVVIGRNCKIESHSFICDGVSVEDDVFIGHGVMFTNDLYPTVSRQVKRLKTRVGSHVGIGSNATIVGGIEIGAGSIIGAGAVVVRDVPRLSIVSGNPARVQRSFTDLAELRRYMEARQETAV